MAKDKCKDCWDYKHPKVIRHYVTDSVTQAESDRWGWRTCAYGATVMGHSVNSCWEKREGEREA